jgi:hypothetical protein
LGIEEILACLDYPEDWGKWLARSGVDRAFVEAPPAMACFVASSTCWLDSLFKNNGGRSESTDLSQFADSLRGSDKEGGNKHYRDKGLLTDRVGYMEEQGGVKQALDRGSKKAKTHVSSGCETLEDNLLSGTEPLRKMNVSRSVTTGLLPNDKGTKIFASSVQKRRDQDMATCLEYDVVYQVKKQRTALDGPQEISSAPARRPDGGTPRKSRLTGPLTERFEEEKITRVRENRLSKKNRKSSRSSLV